MTDRRGIIFIMFDLPSLTKDDKKEYTKFKSFLKKEGYSQLQESVYVKLIHNISFAANEEKKVNKNKPKSGTLSVLSLSLSDFSKFHTILGTGFDVSWFSDDTLFV